MAMNLNRKRFRITGSVIQQIERTIGMLPPECGGILGAGEDGIISEFYFDQTGKSCANGYAPDVNTINRILMDEWMPNRIFMVGIVHSHHPGIPSPSCGDMHYGIRILQMLDTVDTFYLPIVTVSNGSCTLHPYAVYPNEQSDFTCSALCLENVSASSHLNRK